MGAALLRAHIIIWYQPYPATLWIYGMPQKVARACLRPRSAPFFDYTRLPGARPINRLLMPRGPKSAPEGPGGGGLPFWSPSLSASSRTTVWIYVKPATRPLFMLIKKGAILWMTPFSLQHLVVSIVLS